MDMNCLPLQEFGRISTNCISLFQTEDLDVIFIGWVIMTSDVNSNMILVYLQCNNKEKGGSKWGDLILIRL